VSQAVETGRTLAAPGAGTALWSRQIRAILALELRKNLLGRRALPMYFLASMPVALMMIRAVLPVFGVDLDFADMGRQSKFYSTLLFQGFILRFVVFFGCVAIFTNLFRGEVVDRSMHYYFLAPVRREVLAAGKYLSGVVSTVLIFGAMTVVSYLLLYAPSPGTIGSYLLGGPGLGHLLAYVGITILACLGYGAVFMLLGLIFRNPVIPAAFILVWEMLLNPFLPSLLKKVSVIHYLNSLAPVPADMGSFALVGEPTSPWVAVPGLLLVCAALLGGSALLVRHLEIRYGND
jgi:ABC-type transport system involved in multi-copper enzyme maturation permease subunit